MESFTVKNGKKWKGKKLDDKYPDVNCKQFSEMKVVEFYSGAGEIQT